MCNFNDFDCGIDGVDEQLRSLRMNEDFVQIDEVSIKNTKIDSNCDDRDKDTDQHEVIKHESSYSSHSKSNCEHDKNSTDTDFDSADSSSIRSSEKNCEKSSLESSFNDVSNENAVHAIIKKIERNNASK